MAEGFSYEGPQHHITEVLSALTEREGRIYCCFICIISTFMIKACCLVLWCGYGVSCCLFLGVLCCLFFRCLLFALSCLNQITHLMLLVLLRHYVTLWWWTANPAGSRGKTCAAAVPKVLQIFTTFKKPNWSCRVSPLCCLQLNNFFASWKVWKVTAYNGLKIWITLSSNVRVTTATGLI